MLRFSFLENCVSSDYQFVSKYFEVQRKIGVKSDRNRFDSDTLEMKMKVVSSYLFFNLLVSNVCGMRSFNARKKMNGSMSTEHVHCTDASMGLFCSLTKIGLRDITAFS